MKQIHTSHAPAPFGPYSQAVRVSNLVFLSGQIPATPDGRILSGSIKEQTLQVLENIKAILAAEGLSLKDVVKTTIYLTDLSMFQEVNALYGEYFSPPYPARTTVGVKSLPKGVDIEMDVIAVVE
ncbi:MAG TPA: RidA family protein [Deltaproteobacteria bacterium]|nr:RidA family protein [Deltaproteobacteria bacterium]